MTTRKTEELKVRKKSLGFEYLKADFSDPTFLSKLCDFLYKPNYKQITVKFDGDYVEYGMQAVFYDGDERAIVDGDVVIKSKLFGIKVMNQESFDALLEKGK